MWCDFQWPCRSSVTDCNCRRSVVCNCWFKAMEHSVWWHYACAILTSIVTKNRMMGLPEGEKIVMICLLVLTQFMNVTDTQTHTHTYTAWRHRPRLCIVKRDKKWCVFAEGIAFVCDTSFCCFLWYFMSLNIFGNTIFTFSGRYISSLLNVCLR